jgi:hypothetical protein
MPSPHPTQSTHRQAVNQSAPFQRQAPLSRFIVIQDALMTHTIRVATVSTLLAGMAGLGAADYDVVVYGGTSAGVIAAVQAKKMGKSVVIVGPDKHLGGLASGGLGFTDTGDKRVIGGLSRDFYHRIWQHYNDEKNWTWQKKAEYGGKGQGTPAVDGENRTMWIFEPHAAEAVFESYVKEFAIPVERDE